MKAAALLLLVLSAPSDPRVEWIRAARDAHEMADQSLAHAQPGAARDALKTFLDLPVPTTLSRSDAIDVEQDVWFRVADLDLGLGDAAAARDDAKHGLDLAGAGLFEANLYIVRGRAFELLHDDRAAIADYQEAQRINELLLAQAVENKP